MTPAARVSAAIEILDLVLDGARAETSLKRWARKNRYAGSKDRAAIRDYVYSALRQRESSLCCAKGARTGRSMMRGLLHLQGVDLASLFCDARFAPVPLTPEESTFGTPTHPWQVHDIPEWLWPLWCDSLGEDALQIAQSLQQRAPVFLRVNLLKGTQAEAISSLLEAGYEVHAHPYVPTALSVIGRSVGLQNTIAFSEGLVELQDAHSQASVTMIARDGSGPVLDYCAGGGGKALALAAWLDTPVHAHDVNPKRMSDLPARALRANARVTCVTREQISNAYDTVFCDAPCSGSGSWRRDPEGKWALDQNKLNEFIQTQREILSTAAELVADGGKLVYATCSVLACENTDQVAWFLDQNNRWTVQNQTQWYPNDNGDGFFASVLTQL